MKKFCLICIYILLFTGAFGMSMFNKDGVLHFDYTAEGLAPAEAKARIQFEKDLSFRAELRPNTQLGLENSNCKVLANCIWSHFLFRKF